MKNKSKLASEIAKDTGYSVSDVDQVLSSLINVLESNVLSFEDCKLGCITFGVKKTPARSGKNPLSGEAFEAPEHYIPYVKLGKGFKNKFKEKNS